jgi:hypothetical protein
MGAHEPGWGRDGWAIKDGEGGQLLLGGPSS